MREIDTLDTAAMRAIEANRVGISRIEVVREAEAVRSRVSSEVFPGVSGVIVGRVPCGQKACYVSSVSVADVLRAYGLALKRNLLGDDRVPARPRPKLRGFGR